MDNPTDSPPLISLPESEHRPLSVRAKALVFADPASRAVLRFVEQIGPSAAPALILGETGTGAFRQSGGVHAALQVAGAIAAVAILLFVARIEISRVRLGIVAFVAIAAGGLAMGMAGSIAVNATGFLLVVGFDKMFNAYIRSARQAIIPPRDYGKTTGVIVLLNNATQPLAGLLVGRFSGHGRVAPVVTLTSIVMAIPGGAVVAIGAGRARSTARVSD